MIEHVDIINLSHYDIGFTEHPAVCRELQVRFLDMAVDLAAKNPDGNPERWFYWTCESNDVVLDWWQKASAKRRELFLKLARKGWIEVCAMPFNQTPRLDARQWQCCAHWLPGKLWKAFRPRTIMQNDVNGFPRSGVMALMDAGAEFLWMGLNCDTGSTPVPQPSAFWWAMPDGRKIFVWNSIGYPGGYFLFEKDEWRKGPLPTVGDTRYRPPRTGDILDTSPENLKKAQKICRSQLEKWQKNGYLFNRMAVSMTNMWRIDNDPPCAQLPDFVRAWNLAGLKPALALTTPAKALAALRSLANKKVPTLTGEWTDWWANGMASMPRELSASRKAKRILAALDSPLYRRSPARVAVMNRCRRELCFFDEHTNGSWNSAAKPDSLDSKGQFAEKAILAYRPLAVAELSVGDANRTVAPKSAGIHVVNPYRLPFTGWVELTDDCLRGRFAGVQETLTGKEQAFDRVAGVSAFSIPAQFSQFTPMDSAKVFPDNIAGKRLRFWVENLGPNTVRSYCLMRQVRASADYSRPEIMTDKTGWPAKISWPKRTLFTSPLADFFSLEFQGPFPRWKYKEIMTIPTLEQRRNERQKHSLVRQSSSSGTATVRDTGPTLVYTQYLKHSRLRRMQRILEVFKDIPRVKLQVTINRISKPESAEIFYVRFPLNCRGYNLRVASGGVAFRPGKEQLPHSCKDYFAIDGQVAYTKGTSRVVLNCYDNALVAFGGMNDGLMLPQIKKDLHTVYAILYNNIWYTNFAGDEAGLMTFEFDLYAGGGPDDFAPAAFPVVLV